MSRLDQKVHAASPWLKADLRQFEHSHPDTLAELEARIPPDHHVSLICGGSPRPLGAILTGPSGEVRRAEPAYYTVGAAVLAVLPPVTIEVEVNDGFRVVADLAS